MINEIWIVKDTLTRIWNERFRKMIGSSIYVMKKFNAAAICDEQPPRITYKRL